MKFWKNQGLSSPPIQCIAPWLLIRIRELFSMPTPRLAMPQRIKSEPLRLKCRHCFLSRSWWYQCAAPHENKCPGLTENNRCVTLKKPILLHSDTAKWLIFQQLSLAMECFLRIFNIQQFKKMIFELEGYKAFSNVLCQICTHLPPIH